MIVRGIDKGKSFDWGKTSADYAKYRDIYPQEFYDYILNLGLCKDGQKVLDLGTGTGVLPRNMYKYGAKWTGTDISENQIEQAKMLVKEAKMDIDFFASRAEDVSFPDNTFDVLTACRGVEASMSPETLAAWDKEHKEMLEKNAPENFTVKHYVSIAELQVRKSKNV
ncbi:MAG: class I SAM-dependent methyltransferase [Treponema sp.]|nr:class I SAM-dependent methyltransferase [Treponema sp.]